MGLLKKFLNNFFSLAIRVRIEKGKGMENKF